MMHYLMKDRMLDKNKTLIAGTNCLNTKVILTCGNVVNIMYNK